ncbi:MAG TPA: RNA-directed DNA polymerase [Bacteroidetes bacterium]|nr:RNA-directed DNA polymerase [Bacteroidota bacterium]
MADSSLNRRQELYDRIRSSSKDQVILEEMQKMGFWPDDSEEPSVPALYFKRELELSQELRDLVIKHRRFDDQAKMLEHIRRERMAESRKKQKETKQRRRQERLARAEAWKQRKASEILYLGEGVSQGLQGATPNRARLTQHGLTDIASVEALALAMGMTVGKLRFLAYNREISRVSHYIRFHLPKKRGGTRLISAPKPGLKSAQYWVLQHILDRIELHDAAHGFRKARSIVTNAKPHLGADLVVNIDLKDFFPTVNYRRVKGLFGGLGYSERISTVLGLLCTEPDVDVVELDGETWYVAKGERHLPQGAPCSPAITNIMCRRLDARMRGLAQKYGFVYSRYADDMTFSASGDSRKLLMTLLGNVRRILKDENFKLHPDKLRIMRKGAQKEVTGIIVNEKLNVSRKKLKKFRALIFQIEKDGPEGKTWEGARDLLPAIWGYANFIKMVNPDKGAEFVARVKAIFDHLGETPPVKPVVAQPDGSEVEVEILQGSDEDEAPGATGNDPDKPWWKIW